MNRKAILGVGIRVVAAVAFVAAANAQTPGPINQQIRLQIQNSGQMFDANPSVYGGRFNTPARNTMGPLMLGNLAASGQLTMGASLRVGTVPSATEFRGSLGSGTLSNFRRDSVSAAYATSPRPRLSYIQPYFDPSTTVSSAGYLQGFTPGVSAQGLGMARTSPARTNLPSIERPTAPNPFAPPADPALGTSSTIFRPATPGLAMPGSEPPRAPRAPGSLDVELPGATPDVGAFMRSNLSPDAPTARSSGLSTMQSPLDALLGADNRANIGLMSGDSRVPPWMRDSAAARARPGLIVPQPREGDPQAALPPGLRPRVTDASILPGHDVFTDMRLALALETNPQARWFEDMREAAASVPDLIDTPEEALEASGEEFVEKMIATPLKSFTGEGATAVNNLMLKAEELMNVGHFFEAADRYRAAHTLDPANPLPLIGRGHALLAAGDYRSAANALLSGIERFPDITRFAIDLEALLGGGENVDIRRADIMRRLEANDNPELRFLLGYLEYHTGQRERGLQNLRRAAEHPLSSATIHRYPSMLMGEGPLPPPKFDNSTLRDEDASQ